MLILKFEVQVINRYCLVISTSKNNGFRCWVAFFFLPQFHGHTWMHAIVQGTVGLNLETCVLVLALHECCSPGQVPTTPSLQYVTWDNSVFLAIGFCGSGDSGN